MYMYIIVLNWTILLVYWFTGALKLSPSSNGFSIVVISVYIGLCVGLLLGLLFFHVVFYVTILHHTGQTIAIKANQVNNPSD